MQIDLITSVTPELQSAVRRLIPQLTSRNPPKEDDLVALVQSDSSSLVVARESGSPIAGMACVSVYRVPTGVRAIIEDVVVDGPARGKGIGESLIRRCLEIARAKGAEAVTLTSNPSRDAANRLYVRIGFRPRETNSYIYAFS